MAGSAVGVSEEEVDVAIDEALTDPGAPPITNVQLSSLFRTGTATSTGPGTGNSIVFTTPVDTLIGSDIAVLPDGTYQLGKGVYLLDGCMRGGTYSTPTGFLNIKWTSSVEGQIGNECIQYANASTNAFTHQPMFSAILTVPDGETRIVTPQVIFNNAGSWTLSEQRSYHKIVRIS